MISEDKIENYLANFELDDNQRSNHRGTTAIEYLQIGSEPVKVFYNEFWTARQRQASSIHEISYRACFKPQLPRFFIDLLTEPQQFVYDPFAGRGTTAIEAALLGRNIIANDINPLSKILCEPRLNPPAISKLEARLAKIDLSINIDRELDLSMFYHQQTESELLALRHYLSQKKVTGMEDKIDNWIRMVATNRLTGHSKGFFSVYTMPPNQAISAERQVLINRKRQQVPYYRDIKAIILNKSKQLLRNLTKKQLQNLESAAIKARFLENCAATTVEIETDSIDLTVTSPPFLDVVQYSEDNWLRLWFNNISRDQINNNMMSAAKIEIWEAEMSNVFGELFRITKPGGWVAFEVGEVKKGKLKLEEVVIPHAISQGFKCCGLVINSQQFTKTSNIWGIKNNKAGTNSNRIAILKKLQGCTL